MFGNNSTVVKKDNSSKTNTIDNLTNYNINSLLLIITLIVYKSNTM